MMHFPLQPGDAASDANIATRAHVRQVTIFFCALVMVIFTLGMWDSWDKATGFALFLLCVFAIPPTLLIGVVILIVRGGRIARRMASWRHGLTFCAAPPALAAALIFVSPSVASAGRRAGCLSQLLINGAKYRAIIAQAQGRKTDPGYRTDLGITYEVDPGPPVRVAFNPGGMLDNWTAILYDPSGLVMQANGFDRKTGKFAAPDGVTQLFGGDLIGCDPLWGDYYSCSFT